jgi:hypothetical protein
MPSLFIQRDPNASRAEALQQAREFLLNADPISDDEDKNFNMYLSAAGLFLMYQEPDNDLGMAGADEMHWLACRLKQLVLDAAVLATIHKGICLPSVDEEGELIFTGVVPEDFDNAGVCPEVQKEYYRVNE